MIIRILWLQFWDRLAVPNLGPKSLSNFQKFRACVDAPACSFIAVKLDFWEQLHSQYTNLLF